MAVGDYGGFAAKARLRLVAIFLALFDDISIFFLFLHPFLSIIKHDIDYGFK